MPTRRLERSLERDGCSLIVGIDEVGRGALAGPLVSASVVLPRNCRLKLADSKKLSQSRRLYLANKIIDQCIDFGIGVVNAQEVDELRLTNATSLCYERSLECLGSYFSKVIIDGNYDYLKDYEIAITQVKADENCSVVSAASIIAKVYRDTLMQGSAKSITYYAFEKNVGYATKSHKAAIEKFGLSSMHRKTFISTI